MRNKRILFIILTLVLAAVVQGVHVHAQKEVVFTYGICGMSVNFNPLTGYSYTMYRSILWATLYRINETWGSEPWAAEYAKKIDPLTWEIKLRDDLYWHDGEPVTSEDYKFTWELLMKYSATQARFLKGVKSIEIVSDKVFRVHMEYPIGGCAIFLTGVNVPVPKHLWEPMGLTDEKVLAYENIPPIGNGPFKFVEYKPGEHIVFEAFDKFFAGRPKIDKLIVRIFSSTENMIAALKAGEIDAVSNVPEMTALQLTSLPGLHVHTSPIPSFRSMYINQYPQPKKGHPALDDLTVRKAMAMSIDKEAINDLIHPAFMVGWTPIPPMWKEFNPKVKEIWPKFNLTAAEQLLEEAGYKDTNGDGVREDPKSGMPLKFRLIVYNAYPEEMRAAELISQWFRQVGMDLEIKGMEATAWDIVVTPPYDWDLETWGWTIHDPISCWWPFTSEAIPSGWSSSGNHDPKFDDLYLSLLNAKDQEEYIATQYKLQEYFVENVVEIVFYHEAISGVWRVEWTGFEEEPSNIFWYGFNSKAFLNVHPVTSPAPPVSPAVPPWTWVLVGIIVAAVVVTFVVVIRARRKGK